MLLMMGVDRTVIEGIARLAREWPGLALLLLIGSRARSDAREGSDWDFGYLGGPAFEPLAFLADLAGLLRTDRIDLVDLQRAGAQLRFRAAAEGRVLHATDPAAFARFWMEAVSFWCDAGPVIQEGYREVLADLDR